MRLQVLYFVRDRGQREARVQGGGISQDKWGKGKKPPRSKGDLSTASFNCDRASGEERS